MSSLPVNRVKIIFDQEDLLVINKPSGVSVHNEEPSILGWLSQTFPKVKNPGEQFHFPLRLDRETSGVMPIVRDGSKTEFFRQAVQTKKYLAILRGQTKEQKGTWAFPISDKAEGIRNPAGKASDRVNAITHFEVMNQNRYFTWVSCVIETGRQHQIRKHAALAGHAIVGDGRYNDSKYNKMIFDRYKIQRLFLHCQQLQVNWPTNQPANQPEDRLANQKNRQQEFSCLPEPWLDFSAID